MNLENKSQTTSEQKAKFTISSGLYDFIGVLAPSVQKMVAKSAPCPDADYARNKGRESTNFRADIPAK
jgi:hypothetical protein